MGYIHFIKYLYSTHVGDFAGMLSEHSINHEVTEPRWAPAGAFILTECHDSNRGHHRYCSTLWLLRSPRLAIASGATPGRPIEGRPGQYQKSQRVVTRPPAQAA